MFPHLSTFSELLQSSAGFKIKALRFNSTLILLSYFFFLFISVFMLGFHTQFKNSVCYCVVLVGFCLVPSSGLSGRSPSPLCQMVQSQYVSAVRSSCPLLCYRTSLS